MENFIDAIATATKLYQSDDHFQAELICSQILDIQPDNLDALYLLGRIKYHLSKNTVATTDVGLRYHLWYYNQQIWNTTFWTGVKALKSPSDMWNYQEIIWDLKPSLIIEFGSCYGGGTLFFANVLAQINENSKVFSVDIDHKFLHPKVRNHPRIELMLSSSTAPAVAQRIAVLRSEFPGPVFAILDSNHEKQHVLGEMQMLRPLLKTGDYLIVEDSNINGHPVLPGWGEGPYEAMAEYFAIHPNDYQRDDRRENKFGFTFATNGFLMRR
ncbi:CmcI family methyltransferase [Microcoleus sp. herbarium14]|uniref:CmcI family methyltransferase n=1 Tax=Microcoleus sp. herbarium14 TaxID=3055439 RepID=UPI002FCEF13A